jgi:hypothetical protein
MHDENDPEIEYSPLCEEVTRDGLTVRVQIYRLKTGNDGWSLEVVDHEDASTVWGDLFATDHEALAEFFPNSRSRGYSIVSNESGSAELVPKPSAAWSSSG